MKNNPFVKSEAESLGSKNLPQGWCFVTIGDTGKYINGYAFKPQHREVGGYPIIRIQNLTNPDKFLNRTSLEVSEEYRVSTGEMLVSWSATVDVFIWNREPALVNQHIFRVVPNDELVDKTFLFHWLKVAIDQLLESEYLHGSTMKHINRGPFMAHRIPLPPRAEQERIAETLEETLSELDAGVAELKAAQRKLVQYRQSLLKAAVEGTLTADWRAARAKSGEPQETGADLLQRILTERRVTWEAKQLSKFAEQCKAPPKDWPSRYAEPASPECAELPVLPANWTWATIEQISANERYSLAIGPFGSNLTVADYRNEGIPLVFVRNIRSRSYRGDDTKFVTPQKGEELKAHSIQANDVLVTKMGEPPGDADVYPSDGQTAIITADCIKVRCQYGLMQPQFLAAAINSPLGKKQVKPITQGVAQKKVSLGRFATLAIPIPPIEEQSFAIALMSAATKEIDEQIKLLERHLQLATAQRKNILKAAFSGKLVPQDPTDEPASVLLERIRAERATQADSTKKRGRKARENA